MKKYVVVDFDPAKASNIDEWNKFLDGLRESSSDRWELFGTEIKDESFHSMERYLHYFQLAWKLFISRKNIDKLLANQQFYGIIFAFYCRLFRVKKTTKNVIISFIYNEKKGFKGKLYRKFIQFSIKSNYVDKLIVHSLSEIDYYSQLLDIPKNKLIFCTLGITDDSRRYDITNNTTLKESYVLGVGNSNRDFSFMETALLGEPYKVRIFSDTYIEHQKKNIEAKRGIPVSQYYQQLAGAFCSVIPIDNPNISSGQLSILQSYAFGKPVIVTKSNVNDIYIGDENAIVISKDKEELRKAIRYLENTDVYEKQVNKARAFFQDKFSMYAMGKTIGRLF